MTAKKTYPPSIMFQAPFNKSAVISVCGKFREDCRGMPGSKHRLQRASYASVEPVKISSPESTSRCEYLAGAPQRIQIARVFVIDSARQATRAWAGTAGP